MSRYTAIHSLCATFIAVLLLAGMTQSASAQDKSVGQLKRQLAFLKHERFYLNLGQQGLSRRRNPRSIEYWDKIATRENSTEKGKKASTRASKIARGLRNAKVPTGLTTREQMHAEAQRIVPLIELFEGKIKKLESQLSAAEKAAKENKRRKNRRRKN